MLAFGDYLVLVQDSCLWIRAAGSEHRLEAEGAIDGLEENRDFDTALLRYRLKSNDFVYDMSQGRSYRLP